MIPELQGGDEITVEKARAKKRTTMPFEPFLVRNAIIIRVLGDSPRARIADIWIIPLIDIESDTGYNLNSRILPGYSLMAGRPHSSPIPERTQSNREDLATQRALLSLYRWDP